MRAMRCEQCGDVRWSLLGLAAAEPARCLLCGETMVPERRRPDGARRGGLERRSLLAVRPPDTIERPPAAPAP